jgi:hypothetical protein
MDYSRSAPKHVVPARLFSLFQPTPAIDETSTTSKDTPAINKGRNFPDLPFEIRTAIYSLAIPLSRVLRIRLVHPETGPVYAQSISPPCIPTILHINRESRAVGLKIFRRSFGPSAPTTKSSILERDMLCSYWNPAIDTLFLPVQNPSLQQPIQVTSDEDLYQRNFYEEEYEDLDVSLIGDSIYHDQHILSYVRHLALPENMKVRMGFSTESQRETFEFGQRVDLSAWLSRFEHLQSLTILSDPFPGWYRSGEIVLYELLEEQDPDRCTGVALPRLRMTERSIEEALEEYATGREWKAPSVELLIMGHRKTRKVPAFCVKPKKRAVTQTSIFQMSENVK